MNKVKEQKKLYRFRMIQSRIKHGLLLLTIRNALMRIGLDFEPYWVELEGLSLCDEPKLKNDDPKNYILKKLDDQIILDQYELLSWNTSELIPALQSEHYSIGLYNKDRLAAFMIIRIGQYTYKNRKIPLKRNEAYLENMYTYESFRGRNLAPFLRYQSYKLLEEEGKTSCYSLTQYFNKSSLRFKQKLNAKHLELWLHLGLFKRFQWNFLLKTYANR